jgi:hypothetical protein
MNDALAPPSSIEAERELIGTLLALYKPQRSPCMTGIRNGSGMR